MEHSAAALDGEYRKHLGRIKTHIHGSRDFDTVKHCQEWLLRLNDTPAKAIRNQYSELLCQQLDNGALGMPFTCVPPAGSLRDMYCVGSQLPEQPSAVRSSEWSDIIESEPTDEDSSSYAAPVRGLRRQEAARKKPRASSLPRSSVGHRCPVLQMQDRDTIKGKFEQQIGALQGRLLELQREKESLTRQLALCRNELTRRSDAAATSIHGLMSEIAVLRQRLQELGGVKAHLEVTQSHVIGQWHDALDSMMSRVAQIEGKNQRLQAAVDKTVTQLDVLDAATFNNISDVQKSCSDRLRECQQRYTNEYEMLRNACQANSLEMEQQSQQLLECEQKLNARTEEVFRLKTALNEQCAKLTTEMADIRKQLLEENEVQLARNNDEHTTKLQMLQKYIAKLEKSNTRSIRNYEKKLKAVTLELQMQERSTQIKLDMQRSNLMITASSEKQEEISKIVGDLEGRYTQLLDEQKTLAGSRLSKDQSTIQDLKDAISRLETSEETSMVK